MTILKNDSWNLTGHCPNNWIIVEALYLSYMDLIILLSKLFCFLTVRVHSSLFFYHTWLCEDIPYFFFKSSKNAASARAYFASEPFYLIHIKM